MTAGGAQCGSKVRTHHLSPGATRVWLRLQPRIRAELTIQNRQAPSGFNRTCPPLSGRGRKKDAILLGGRVKGADWWADHIIEHSIRGSRRGEVYDDGWKENSCGLEHNCTTLIGLWRSVAPQLTLQSALDRPAQVMDESLARIFAKQARFYSGIVVVWTARNLT